MEALGIKTEIPIELLLAFAIACSLTATVCDAIDAATKGVTNWAVTQVGNRAEAVMPSSDR